MNVVTKAKGLTKMLSHDPLQTLLMTELPFTGEQVI